MIKNYLVKIKTIRFFLFLLLLLPFAGISQNLTATVVNATSCTSNDGIVVLTSDPALNSSLKNVTYRLFDVINQYYVGGSSSNSFSHVEPGYYRGEMLGEDSSGNEIWVSTGNMSFRVTYDNETSVPTAAASQSFCVANNPTVASLSATGTNIKWYNAYYGGTALASTKALVNGAFYCASQTVNGCESLDRTGVTVIITSNFAAPTGNRTQEFCAGNNATVGSLIVNGTGILWYNAATGGSVVASGTVLTNNTTYYASQTVNGCESTTRLPVTATISNPAAPTGNASQTFCASANPTVASLSATGTGIKWYDSAIQGNEVASGTALTNGTIYYASQTVSGCESPTRLAVNVNVTDVPAPGNLGDRYFCDTNNSTLANFSISGTGIKWYDAPTGGNLLPLTTALLDGVSYYASQTVNGCESSTRSWARSNIINTSLAPTANSPQEFCSGSNLTLSSLLVYNSNNSGYASNVKWYDGATGGNVLPSATALTNGTTYYASQTVNGCESTARVAITVKIGIDAPTGTALQTFCASANPTVTSLIVTGTVVQWYSAATGGSVLSSTTALINGTTYYASQTVNGCESATRFAVTAIVKNTQPPTGPASVNWCGIYTSNLGNLEYECRGTNIKWYDAAIGGNILLSGTVLENNKTYYASQTVDGCESATRLAVLVNIFDSPPTGNALQSFDTGSNPTIASLSVTGTGSIRWFDISGPGGGLEYSLSTALVNGRTYYASQTINYCQSRTRFGVTVTLVTSPPTGNATQTFCFTSNPIVASLTANGTAIKWYESATGGNSLASGSH
ncbi:hypothetical protein [Flavobacterium sp. WG21]|uniref:Ig-like domain-containing protein n=1 Tax=Flavobacterium sp. WG21 TaxID=1229487 RepID=UPI00034C42FD|nr:hypothetical protein [Flavobacterium sp. WG21]